MSHFDDVEPIFWGSSGGGNGGPVGAVLFLIVAVVAICWATCADQNSANLCAKFGERYVDSNSRYTLCEKSDGTVVRC